MPNLRLGLLGDVDGLGIASALDVEDGVLSPAMLVVADELAIFRRRERGLARAGKAEEHTGAVRNGVHVAGAVHGKDAVLNGQQVVHRREDGFLDLARVLRADDEDDLLGEVDKDRGLRVRVVTLGVKLKPRRSHDDEVGKPEVGKLLLRGAHKHLMGKERLARELGDDAELAGVAAIGTCNAMDDEKTALREVRDDLRLDAGIVLLRHGNVYLAPGDIVMHLRRVDDESVVRGATSVLTSLDAQGTGGGKRALAAIDRLLDEDGGRAVDPRHVVGMCDPVMRELLNDHACLLTAAKGPVYEPFVRQRSPADAHNGDSPLFCDFQTVKFYRWQPLIREGWFCYGFGNDFVRRALSQHRPRRRSAHEPESRGCRVSVARRSRFLAP